MSLYFDSFATEGYYPYSAQHASFFIDKDTSGSNLNDQWISVITTGTPAGFSQGYGLDQYDELSSVYNNRLWWALDVLGSAVALFLEPLSIAETLIYGARAYTPGSSDYVDADWDETQAAIWWFNPGYDFGLQNPIRQYAHNAIRWIQKVDVNPDTYYGIKLRGEIDLPSPNPFGVGYIETPYVRLRIYKSGGGSGCPMLYVYDGSDYVCEGLLDIHNPEGVDLVYQHTLAATPQRENGAYLLRLTEHPKTHSYIDQVKLYAILEDQTMKKLPLTRAWHSEDGNVLPMLLHSDEWKTDTLGADHNDGTSQSIDLKFAALSPNLEIVGFVFQIEGNNPEFEK